MAADNADPRATVVPSVRQTRVAPAGESTSIRHGGDLDEAERTFPGGPRPWIDLSTGINPVPYPMPALSLDHFARLPSRSDLAELEAAAAVAYGVKDPSLVVAAPGTQALIGLLPRLRSTGRAAILAPTYGEHAPAWRHAGHRVVEVSSPEELADADVSIAVNPNNPDGRILSVDDLQRLARRLAARQGWLVVDEAFADLEDFASLAPDLPANAVLLRSFGKTYGLAGVRLGFAIAPLQIAAEIRRGLGPWPLSGAAIAIGRTALADPKWRRAAAAARAADGRRLDRIIAGLVDRVVGGTRLFRLYQLDHASALFEHIGGNGIWVRRFDSNPTWLRFGLPGSAPAWARLEAALGSFG